LALRRVCPSANAASEAGDANAGPTRHSVTATISARVLETDFTRAS
jgi:hypothetical protein